MAAASSASLVSRTRFFAAMPLLGSALVALAY